jgi:CRISPR-associated exonuclease Cas4
MIITASHLTYYLLCHRKLWLHHWQMRMEDNSDAVAIGKQIEAQSYKRRSRKWRQLDLGHIKIDYFSAADRLVREVKKSPKLEHVHVAQVKYYLHELEKNGIEGITGILEYPEQRKRTIVELTDEDREVIIPGWMTGVEAIVTAKECPPLIEKPYCKKCAFHDFCYV